MFAVNWGFNEESSNNVYDGCAIMYGNNMIDNNSKIKDSYIYKSNNDDITINNINLENCEIKVHGGNTIFNNSNIKECTLWSDFQGSTQPALSFNNSTMTCNDITSQDYFAINTFFDASTINVLGEVTKSAFVTRHFQMPLK